MWNFTQNFESIHCKICILFNLIFVCDIQYLKIATSEALVRLSPDLTLTKYTYCSPIKASCGLTECLSEYLGCSWHGYNIDHSWPIRWWCFRYCCPWQWSGRWSHGNCQPRLNMCDHGQPLYPGFIEECKLPAEHLNRVFLLVTQNT